jgi:hypothetical protein
MKLKKYDASVQSTRTGEPRISFDDKGVIRINKTAVQAIGLKAGDKVSFLQDEENPTDWYLSKDKDGFPTRDVNDSGGLVINSSKTRNDFYASLFEANEEEGRRSFPLAIEPEKNNGMLLYAILTA